MMLSKKQKREILNLVAVKLLLVAICQIDFAKSVSMNGVWTVFL